MIINNKPISPAAQAAIAKLTDGKKEVKGQKEKAVMETTVDALSDFCRQSDDFAEAVVETGKCLRECLEEVMRGVGSSISDIEVYRRAVAFWLPGYTAQMQLILVKADPAGGGAPERSSAEEAAPAKPKKMVLTLEDLL